MNEAVPRRRGRPSRTDSADAPAARDRILTAAREEFSERGYDKTSVRGIAKAADVDPALVHHYFGTKEQVFEAAIGVALGPLLSAPGSITDGPLDGVGERLARFFFGVWENPATRKALLAIVRSAVNNEVAAGIPPADLHPAAAPSRRPARPPGRGTPRRTRRRSAGGHCDAEIRDQGRALGLGNPGPDHRQGGPGDPGPPDSALSWTRPKGARGTARPAPSGPRLKTRHSSRIPDTTSAAGTTGVRST